MVLLAQLSLVSGWDVSFLLELIFAMSKRTGVSELALSVKLPVLAHL